MRINPILPPLIIISFIFGTVFAADKAGLWSTSGKTGINMESMSALDIKGWMTIQQVSDGLKMPVDEVRALLKVPADAPNSAAMKDLEKIIPGFETSTAREALGKRESSPPAPAPTPTAPPIQPTPRITGTHSADGIAVTPTPLPAGQILSPDAIKGSMSLKSVAEQSGVKLDALLAKLNLPADTDVNAALKDLISAGKLGEVTLVRAAVTELLKP